MKKEKNIKLPDKGENPYLNARQEWMERYGSYIQSAKNWRYCAFAALGLSAFLVANNWHLANKSQTVPYILEVNKQGQTFFGGVPTVASVSNPVIIKAALETWIRDARSVLTDPIAERHYIDTVYSFLAKGSPAYHTLTDWYANRQPFALGQEQSIDVQNLSALAVGDINTTKTWTVTWDEVTIKNDGTKTQEHWSANITFKTVPVKATDAIANVNPIGLLITSFSWSRQ
ncbi:VirB8/TrbF family protein [Commensalibacter nepenthis]|uniref:VirB8/TrbF family protein n=1 Tax=Commensalibacter nepenthis TaxID=3043872 RepID=A0ABT6QAF5_9PROT|nr:VirB8/TrbF family protein [Commensalibacter sp. TBRC 10068]MDI2113886.1 VirB8/TrbF family protein [Commensalibacter sp. TBRC 10068]